MASSQQSENVPYPPLTLASLQHHSILVAASQQCHRRSESPSSLVAEVGDAIPWSKRLSDSALTRSRTEECLCVLYGQALLSSLDLSNDGLKSGSELLNEITMSLQQYNTKSLFLRKSNEERITLRSFLSYQVDIIIPYESILQKR